MVDVERMASLMVEKISEAVVAGGELVEDVLVLLGVVLVVVAIKVNKKCKQKMLNKKCKQKM